jgi:hypothetical protein
MKFALQTLLIAGLLCSPPLIGWGQKHATPVPPTLEIEVIDPGVDPLGNPSTQLVPDPSRPGQMQVVTPPTVLVHHFYYTGDRTFQGPMLPGGASILVVNHPSTGERCYVPAQMLPGAPKVTYRSCSIEYDYGENGITLLFKKDCPTLKFRSGKTIAQHTANLLHLNQGKQHLQSLVECTHTHCQRTAAMTCGLVAEASDHVKTATLPLQNTIRMLPFGAALTSHDCGITLAEKGTAHARDHALKHAEKQKKWDALDFRTNR